MEYRIRIIDILPENKHSRRHFFLINSTSIEIDFHTYIRRNSKAVFTLDFYNSTIYLEAPSKSTSIRQHWHELENLDKLTLVFTTNIDSILTWELISI